jgi:hypothetical protein
MAELESVFVYVDKDNKQQRFEIIKLSVKHDIPVTFVPKSNGVLPQLVARIKGDGLKRYSRMANIKRFFETYSNNEI